jgi:hypothetical protein
LGVFTYLPFTYRGNHGKRQRFLVFSAFSFTRLDRRFRPALSGEIRHLRRFHAFSDAVVTRLLTTLEQSARTSGRLYLVTDAPGGDYRQRNSSQLLIDRSFAAPNAASEAQEAEDGIGQLILARRANHRKDARLERRRQCRPSIVKTPQFGVDWSDFRQSTSIELQV